MKIKKIRKKINEYLLKKEDSYFDIKIGDFIIYVNFYIYNEHPILITISSKQKQFKEIEFENTKENVEEILILIQEIQKHVTNLNSIFVTLIESLNKEFEKDFWLDVDEKWFKEDYQYYYFNNLTYFLDKLNIYKKD